MSEENKVVAAGSTAGKSVMPQNQPVNRGLEEEYDKKDLIFPRAKLMQAMSPEVQESGIEQGKIINNLTLEECPESFIPIFKFTNVIKFNPRKTNDPLFNADYEPGAVIWNITDPHDPKWSESDFGLNGEIPTAVRFMSYMVIFEGEEIPCILSFSKTSYKAGKKLFSLLKFTQGDIFAKKFKLIAKKVKGDEGWYFVYEISVNGKSTEEEFSLAEMYYNDFAHRKTDIKINASEDEDKPDGGEVVAEAGQEPASKESDEVNWNE